MREILGFSCSFVAWHRQPAYLREAQVVFRPSGRESSHYHNIRDAIRPLRELYGLLPVGELGRSN